MELNAQEMRREFELQHGCLACGGTLVVRVTPGVARAVCRSCRTFSAMRVVANDDGVSIVNRPAAAA